MTMQDFRGQGPPADIGTFQSPASTIVYQYTFSGVTYTVAARQGDRGWILISCLPTSAANNVIVLTAAFAIGGNVYWRAATYLGNASIPLVSNLTVEGEGWGSTIFSMAGSGGGFSGLQAEGTAGIHLSNIHLRDFRIVGPSAGGVTVFSNLRINYCDDCTIEKVWSEHAECYGIGLRYSTYIQVISCVATDCDWGSQPGAYGIGEFNCDYIDYIFCRSFLNRNTAGGFASDFSGTRHTYTCFLGCRTWDNDGYGILVKSTDSMVVNCVCRSDTGTASPQEIGIDGARNVVYGCYGIGDGVNMYIFESSGSSTSCVWSHNHASGQVYGVRVSGSDCLIESFYAFSINGVAIVVSGTRSIVANSYIYDSVGGNQAILLGASGVYIINPYIYSANVDGIYGTGKSSCVIEGGVIASCGGSGIQLAGTCSGNRILGVTCLSNGAYGINIAAATVSGTEVLGCRLSGNTSGQINDAGTGTILPTVRACFVKELGTAAWIVTAASAMGIDIDAADEGALAKIKLPQDLQQVVRIKVWGTAQVTEADHMTLLIAAGAGGDNESWTGEAIAVAGKLSDTVNFTALDNIQWTFTAADDADIGHLTAGDFLQWCCYYNALSGVDCATDLLLAGEGLEIQYV